MNDKYRHPTLETVVDFGFGNMLLMTEGFLACNYSVIKRKVSRDAATNFPLVNARNVDMVIGNPVADS